MVARMTITNTIMVVTVVSLRVGQVTFCASAAFLQELKWSPVKYSKALNEKGD